MQVTQFFNRNYLSLPAIDKRDNRHLLNLSSNESHSPEFNKLFQEFTQEYDWQQVTKYPIFREAHNAASQYHQVSENQIMLVPGSDFAINLLFNAMSNNARGLITHVPNYVGYLHYATLQNMTILTTTEITSELLLQHSQQIVVITNPEGFLGSRISLEKIRELADICIKQNNLLVIDEAYVEFNSFDHIDLLNSYQNIMIIRSYSKGLGLASMRIGVIIANETIIAYLTRFASENCIADVALAYLTFLLRHPQRIARANQEICKNRDYLIEYLKMSMPEWQIFNSHANFVALIPRSVPESMEIEQMLTSKGIRIRRFSIEDDSVDCIRITIPASEKISFLLHNLMQCYQTSCALI